MFKIVRIEQENNVLVSEYSSESSFGWGQLELKAWKNLNRQTIHFFS